METNSVKIKTKVNEIKEVEIDLTLPHYGKEAPHFYKIFSETDAVQVFWSEGSPSLIAVGVVNISLALRSLKSPISEQDFNAVFEKAINHLKTC